MLRRVEEITTAFVVLSLLASNLVISHGDKFVGALFFKRGRCMNSTPESCSLAAKHHLSRSGLKFYSKKKIYLVCGSFLHALFLQRCSGLSHSSSVWYPAQINAQTHANLETLDYWVQMVWTMGCSGITVEIRVSAAVVLSWIPLAHSCSFGTGQDGLWWHSQGPYHRCCSVGSLHSGRVR